MEAIHWSEKKEEVIIGLECCSRPVDDRCDECPYERISYDECSRQLRKDALELLRHGAPQLRVDNVPRREGALLLTVDDVPHWDGAVWLEFKVISGANGQGGTWAFYVAEQRPNFNFQLQRELQQLTRLPIDTYGYYWRCWSKRPTDEQREGTEWL